MSDYVRDRWVNEQGFPGGPVYAITQTADGYLWVGTERGLVRFDGLSFRLFDHTNSAALPAGPILDLMADVDGSLWIRPQSRNMLRYQDGVFQDVMADLDPARPGVTAMCRGPRGEALFAVRGSGIFRDDGGRFVKLASTAEHSNWLVISLAEMADGKVWVGTRDAGLFSMSDGQLVALTNGVPDKKINCLLAAGGRELWVATDSGIVRQSGDAPAMVRGTGSLDQTQALAMLSDRQSNIWIGTSNGLLRVNASGAASLEANDRRSTGAVNTIFEDREGNLWVGTTQGLERLRDTAFMTYAVSSDSASQGNGAIYVDGDGRTWFAPSSGGLFWQQGGQTGQVKNAGLDRDEIYSLAGSAGELWVGRRRGGLTRLRYNGSSFTAETYTRAGGLAQDSVYAVHQSRDGSVWAGTVSSGLSRLKDGKFITYTTAQGLPSNSITSILESSDGSMWFGTANGLCWLSHDRWAVYTDLDGLPPGNINCLMEDSSGMIWIGTDNGIAILSDGDIQVPREVPEALHATILGLAEDQNGRLWIATTNHVLRVDRDRILSGVIVETDIREFGLADGLRSVGGVRRHRSVIRDALGRIWLSTGSGLSVVDPRQVADRSTPALVRIEGVTADGSAVDLHGALHISSARQRIIFSYAGLSLTVPDRVRYKFKLDSFDQNWSEPVASREAVYTNLDPGPYRFRVMASNSDGLWNSAESIIQIEIDPVFWQTWWFRLSVLMSIALAVLVFYRLRLHHLAKQLNLRFEERLAERTRVAQDLHDTLLQGFLSASMQLHVAADHLPEGSAAKPLVNRVLDLMRQVIEEGRTALKGLRSSDRGIHDLAQSFSDIQQELALEARIDYRVSVEGRPRPLHPVIRDEVYRIGREAVVNAFRHSRADTIEVVLEYASKQLRMHIRDNGCGIDPQVLNTGREGHWGLSGMRERAEEIGARLRLFSAADAGTEVELLIPGHIAFETLPSDRRRWVARLIALKTRPEKAKAKRQGK
ncbi:MAG TPA: two-component regulator propeller domain-containing protein [Blastocatellia bacterium]|nr:two-component regulator propeller domain-containing protein [Blastocatellia bacterium]